MKTIPLNKGMQATVSDEDFEKVRGFKWGAVQRSKTYYAAATIGGRRVYMHRLIMQTPKGLVTDHLNGDGLDNRRSNLRICTHSDNHLNLHNLQKNNKSGYTGVYWSGNRWQVQVKQGKRRYSLGSYVEKEEAIQVRKDFLNGLRMHMRVAHKV